MKHGGIILGLGLSVLMTAPLAAQEAGTTKAGVLTCRTSASLGLIVGLPIREVIACRFAPDGGVGVSENYAGYINRLGL